MQSNASRELVVQKIKEELASGVHLIVIVSAMGRLGDPYATDTLMSLGEWHDASQEQDLVKCCGEFIAASVLTALLKSHEIEANLLYGMAAGLVGDGPLESLNMRLCESSVENYQVTVIPGFHYRNRDGFFATFDRGGSDYTALLYANYFSTEAIFFKDVEGAYYPQGSLEVSATLTHSQLCELQVIQQQAASFAETNKIPLTIRSFMTDGGGTVIRTPLEQSL